MWRLRNGHDEKIKCTQKCFFLIHEKHAVRQNGLRISTTGDPINVFSCLQTAPREHMNAHSKCFCQSRRFSSNTTVPPDTYNIIAYLVLKLSRTVPDLLLLITDHLPE